VTNGTTGQQFDVLEGLVEDCGLLFEEQAIV